MPSQRSPPSPGRGGFLLLPSIRPWFKNEGGFRSPLDPSGPDGAGGEGTYTVGWPSHLFICRPAGMGRSGHDNRPGRALGPEASPTRGGDAFGYQPSSGVHDHGPGGRRKSRGSQSGHLSWCPAGWPPEYLFTRGPSGGRRGFRWHLPFPRGRGISRGPQKSRALPPSSGTGTFHREPTASSSQPPGERGNSGRLKGEPSRALSPLL
jgi:hypothetical protein